MWGSVAVLVGGLYGWLSPGLHNRGRVLGSGVLLGLVVAGVFALLGALIGSPPLGLGSGAGAAIASTVVMALVFLLGVWLGDLLQRYRAAGT